MLNLNYDKEHDILYLRIPGDYDSYCSEVINSINVFRDLESEEVVGFTIFGFMEKYKNNSLSPLPYYDLPISYETDIIKNL